MTKKQNLLLLSILITIGLFVYLTIHHYAIKLGLSASALCSISKTVNCDAAALSSFSEIYSTPVAVLGSFFHLFLLGFIVFARLGWAETTLFLRFSVRAMLLASAIVSVSMGLISVTLVKVICPFCVATYLFSFINLALGWNIFGNLKGDFSFSNYLNQYKPHLVTFAFIPIMSWMTAGLIQESYGLAEVMKLVPEKLEQWRNSNNNDFDLSLGLSNKVNSNRAVLVEFADFKCPHCKMASQTIDTFLKARPDVQFIFKAFPLDGNCNGAENMQKGDGSRCTLAAWTMCAEKISQKGWDVHHWIFANQEELFQVSDLKPYLPKLEKEFGLDGKTLSDCADSSETYDQIKKMAAEGSKAQVSGTPTIYLNGKKLPYGQVLEVLKSAVDELK